MVVWLGLLSLVPPFLWLGVWFDNGFNWDLGSFTLWPRSCLSYDCWLVLDGSFPMFQMCQSVLVFLAQDEVKICGSNVIWVPSSVLCWLWCSQVVLCLLSLRLHLSWSWGLTSSCLWTRPSVRRYSGNTSASIPVTRGPFSARCAKVSAYHIWSLWVGLASGVGEAPQFTTSDHYLIQFGSMDRPTDIFVGTVSLRTQLWRLV